MFSQHILSQTTRKQLESQKAAIQKELKQINELLFKNKKQKAETFSDIEKLSLKIERKQEFIKLTNKQINLLNKDLQENQKKQDQLSIELSQVRSAYKELILQSYKARSGKNRLMFVLSSETFFQAFKRTQYIKQYAVYRKAQANKILKLSEELNKVKEELNERKQIKQQLLNDNRLTQKSLENEKKQADEIAFRLRKEEKKYKRNILAKQRERTRIDKQIDKLIRDAIAASNKSKEKSDSFTLTPEAIALEKNFELNKGKLPWPVEKGVVRLRYGKQRSLIDPKLEIQSNGVRIATERAAKVRAVFKGTVLAVMVQKTSNPVVLIQHGNYITAYGNLQRVFVKKGDEISTKQEIGEVFTDSEGETMLKFSIYKNNVFMTKLIN